MQSFFYRALIQKRKAKKVTVYDAAAAAAALRWAKPAWPSPLTASVTAFKSMTFEDSIRWCPWKWLTLGTVAVVQGLFAKSKQKDIILSYDRTMVRWYDGRLCDGKIEKSALENEWPRDCCHCTRLFFHGQSRGHLIFFSSYDRTMVFRSYADAIERCALERKGIFNFVPFSKKNQVEDQWS